MELLPKGIEHTLPPLYSQDGLGEDAVAQVKFFDPCGAWTWFASEASAVLPNGDYVNLDDPRAAGRVDVLFFGLVLGHERELGYFSLVELQSVKGPLGLGIERDLHWAPRPLRECQ